MDNKPYYYAYENRYQKIFEAGIEHWGHTPDDEILFAALNQQLKSWFLLVPARANDRDGYTAEMQAAGFIVEEFVEMDVNEHCLYSASIL